jgi:hypothetical protein
MTGSITFAQDVCAVHSSLVAIAQQGLILIIVGNGWKIAFWRWRTVRIKALSLRRDVQPLPRRV